MLDIVTVDNFEHGNDGGMLGNGRDDSRLAEDWRRCLEVILVYKCTTFVQTRAKEQKIVDFEQVLDGIGKVGMGKLIIPASGTSRLLEIGATGMGRAAFRHFQLARIQL